MNNPFFTALKLGIIFSCITGCATAEPDDMSSPSEEQAEPAAQTQQSITINTNCMKPLMPGMPTPPCKPDLVFGQVVTTIWKPGNPQNMAPGRYIQIGYRNDSDKQAGPFDIQVKDGSGAVVFSTHVHGLAAHGASSFTHIAPYACGWTRVVTLDSTGAVDEYNEADNAYTMSNPCPRPVAFPGTIQP